MITSSSVMSPFCMDLYLKAPTSVWTIIERLSLFWTSRFHKFTKLNLNSVSVDSNLKDSHFHYSFVQIHIKHQHSQQMFSLNMVFFFIKKKKCAYHFCLNWSEEYLFHHHGFHIILCYFHVCLRRLHFLITYKKISF